MIMMLMMIMMMAIMLRSFSLLTADKLPSSVKRAEHQLFQVQYRRNVLLSYNWYFSVANSTLVYAITKLHIHM